MTVLSLIDGFVGTVREDDYTFVWYTNPFFMISLIIQGLATFLFMIVIPTHYCKWLPLYSLRNGRRIDLIPKEWNNPDCDRHFAKLIE